MYSLTDKDHDLIKAIFKEIITTRIASLEDNRDLFKRFENIRRFITKDTYANETELEKGYAAFRPQLLDAWVRLYQFKQLGEYELTNNASCAPFFFYSLTSRLVSGTDGSETCRSDVVTYKGGLIIKLMLEDLQSDQFKSLALENSGENLTQHIAFCEILVILNCLNSDNILPQLVPMLESGGIVEIIQIYLKSKDPQVRMRAVYLLGYMKNLDKVAKIHAEENLTYCVKYLTDTINCKNTAGGVMLHELLRRFCNLSEMKQHQDVLVNGGLLPQLARIVKGKLVERLHWKPADNVDEFCSFEKALATKCLYPYAIHPLHSRYILAESALITELIGLSNAKLGDSKEEKSLKMEVQRFFMALDISITGEMRAKPEGQVKEILSTIEKITKFFEAKVVEEPVVVKTQPVQNAVQATIQSAKSATVPSQKSPIPPIGHIFISYSHQNSKRAMQLRDMLRDRGLPVWIDAEAIRGNSIEAMVLGLNDARLVIMCLSDGYRQSDFCKREAEYTVLKKKPFQPVILQEGFRMENDWLCFVVGLQNYIDLSGDHQFQTNKNQFIEHVHILFGGGGDSSKTATTQASPNATLAPKAHALGSNVIDRPKSGQLPPLPPNMITESQIIQWKTEQVLKWLDDEGLGNVKDKFKSNDIDGHMLLEMSKLHKKSPEKVLELLKDSLGLNPFISLRVASIIDKLTSS